jgi:hypothetical protein
MFLGCRTHSLDIWWLCHARLEPEAGFQLLCFMMTELLWRSYVSTRAEIPAKGLHFLTLDWIYALYFVGKADLDC